MKATRTLRQTFFFHWFNFSCMSQEGVKSHKRSQTQWGRERHSRTHSFGVVACLIFYCKEPCCTDFKGNSGRGKQCSSLLGRHCWVWIAQNPSQLQETGFTDDLSSSCFSPFLTQYLWTHPKLTSPHLSALLWRPSRAFSHIIMKIKCSTCCEILCCGVINRELFGDEI